MATAAVEASPASTSLYVIFILIHPFRPCLSLLLPPTPSLLSPICVFFFFSFSFCFSLSLIRPSCAQRSRALYDRVFPRKCTACSVDLVLGQNVSKNQLRKPVLVFIHPFMP